jgi:hypothetical protein
MEVERAITADPDDTGNSMSLDPPPASERGGSSRPSRPAPRAVVIALDPEIRDGWARALEATGMEVTRCVGPTVSCALLRGDDRATHAPAMAVATRDRHRADGDHEPSLSHVIAPPGG